MRIVKEGEGVNLIEIGQVVRGQEVLSREFVLYDRDRSFVLTVGTQEYVADLTNLDPGFVSERILVVPTLNSPELEESIERASELPTFQDLLAEQSESEEEVVTP